MPAQLLRFTERKRAAAQMQLSPTQLDQAGAGLPRDARHVMREPPWHLGASLCHVCVSSLLLFLCSSVCVAELCVGQGQWRGARGRSVCGASPSHHHHLVLLVALPPSVSGPLTTTSSTWPSPARPSPPQAGSQPGSPTRDSAKGFGPKLILLEQVCLCLTSSFDLHSYIPLTYIHALVPSLIQLEQVSSYSHHT